MSERATGKMTGLREAGWDFFVGFAMGTANVIPGVSGGTMLFIMGAFEKLVGAIRQVASLETLRLLLRLELRTLRSTLPWRFLLALALGVLVSFATMAKLFLWLLDEHQALTFAFFFGLIAASVITVKRQLGRWTVPAAVSCVLGAAVAYGVITLVPVSTPDCWYMYLLCGAISIIAMILPGLSGSFLLLILGKYDAVWGAVANLAALKFSVTDLGIVFWMALGCVLGLGAFVHLLNYLMKHFRAVTIAALIGFMVGSLPRLWPWQHVTETMLKKGEPVPVRFAYDWPVWDRSFAAIAAAALLGLLIVLGIEMTARRKSAAAAKAE